MWRSDIKVWGFATARRRYHIADGCTRAAICGRQCLDSDECSGWFTLGEITCKRCRDMWLRRNRRRGKEVSR